MIFDGLDKMANLYSPFDLTNIVLRFQNFFQ